MPFLSVNSWISTVFTILNSIRTSWPFDVESCWYNLYIILFLLTVLLYVYYFEGPTNQKNYITLWIMILVSKIQELKDSRTHWEIYPKISTYSSYPRNILLETTCRVSNGYLRYPKITRCPEDTPCPVDTRLQISVNYFGPRMAHKIFQMVPRVTEIPQLTEKRLQKNLNSV